MKVLFAVNNESISESIIKKYQQEYKEIISVKNVYYFNAIIKELQRDKTYDRIVVSEDLQPFSNNNYDAIDKFIFEKMDNISDEATNQSGNDIPIILICTDRRAKSEPLLVKLFGIGVYNALIGKDRSITNVCELLARPRSKKEAKVYYRIDPEDVDYKVESESDVSEIEIQNIMNHYKKLGNDEQKYVESFDHIASQYTDSQLRLIAKFLPLSVKAVLEANSAKYQEVISFGNSGKDHKAKKVVQEETRKNNLAEENKHNKKVRQREETEPLVELDVIEKNRNRNKMTEPVIIPSTINTTNVKKVQENQQEQNKVLPKEMNSQTEQNQVSQSNIPQNQTATNIAKATSLEPKPEENRPMQKVAPKTQTVKVEQIQEIDDILDSLPFGENTAMAEKSNGIKQEVKENIELEEQRKQTQPVEVLSVKRRGRPKKVVAEEETLRQEEQQKRGRGRPKKVEELEQVEIEIPNEITSDEQEHRTIEPENIMIEPQEQSIAQTLQNENQESKQTQGENIIEEETPVAPVNLFELGEEELGVTPEQSSVSNMVLPGLDDGSLFEEIENMGLPRQNNISQENAKDIEQTQQETQEILEVSEAQNMTGFEDMTDFMAPKANAYETNQEMEINDFNSFEPEENNQPVGMYIEPEAEPTIPRSYVPSSQQTFPKEAIQNTNIGEFSGDLSTLLTRDKKVVAFVGTSKNGTSFLVNNTAELLSQKGINTAILDLTKNKNAYYIYTENEEPLRQRAYNCMSELRRGNSAGLQVHKNLTVYTTLPGESEEDISDYEHILETLIRNYSVVILDCDFETPYGYFKEAQELYLVQSLDVLTIQPLTAFLRNLKAKNVLEPEKIRVVLNKVMRLRSISEKTIIGGMAFYNDPAMSFMTELFNKDTVSYNSIPFEEQTYSKYLEGLINCKISLNGYSKNFIAVLEKLADTVYPLIASTKAKGSTPNYNNYGTQNSFSNTINNTLNKMKNNY